jgi:hypothetical protein
MNSRILIALAIFALGCRPDYVPVDNLEPETAGQVDTIIRSGDNRLGTNVHLHWFGSDQDGYITAYEVSVDGQTTTTTSTDSIFSFSIDAGVDTADILLSVAAIDNEGAKDGTPWTLSVPIKNTAPTVEIDPAGDVPDSAFIVLTMDWRVGDEDGDETVELVELKLNGGNWFEINNQPGLLSFAIAPSGNVAFYQNATFIDSIEGGLLGGLNALYLRAKDRAGIYSDVDTTAEFLWGAAAHNTLLINSQPEYIGTTYKAWMDSAGVAYDYIQMDAISGSGIPTYWDPTYEIIMSNYDRIALFTDATQFPTRSGSDYLLNILSTSVRNFMLGGGQLFTASQLTPAMSGAAFLDIFPIESLVSSVGQARLTNDSTLVSLQTGYPSLRPQNIVLGVVPVIPSADATALYNGQVTKIAGWNGSTTMGATRSQNGQVNQVFVALPLHLFTRPTQNGGELLDHVFNAVF